MQRFRCLLMGLLMSTVGVRSLPARAQLTPDQTLGTESSVVTSDTNLAGELVDLIEGGATRGENLFHSFSEFNVESGDRVYFASPAGISSILSRVTSGDVSNINGWLGTAGPSNAELILINPNGIVFGDTVRLDVQGAFTVTTADSIQLGERGVFSATNPDSDSLLSISPSAFFFRNLTATPNSEEIGDISNNSFLQIPDGDSFLLLGRDIFQNEKSLVAPDGVITLAAVGAQGGLVLNNDAGIALAEETGRGNIRIDNSRLDTRLSFGGDIRLIADDIDAVGSQFRTGVLPNMGTLEGQSGDIEIDASGTVSIAGGGYAIANLIEPESVGRGGDIVINAENFIAKEGAIIVAGTFGRGDTGDVVIRAEDSVVVEDIVFIEGVSDNGFSSLISTYVDFAAIGNGGEIDIQSNSLTSSEGGRIVTSTAGEGNAGNINIQVQDLVTLRDVSPLGSFSDVIASYVGTEAIGDGGDIRIAANSLEIFNGAQIAAYTTGIGDAGDVDIQARDSVVIDGISREVNGLYFPSALLHE